MTHAIRTEVPVKFRPAGFDGFETAYPTIDIEYSYIPGSPAFYDPAIGGPGGWSPGDPAEVDFIGATLVDGDGLDPEQSRVDDWAREWLNDAGYLDAVRHAEDHSGPDPDYAYEMRRDDRDGF